MSLFSRRASAPAYDGPPPASMHGRASDLDDAGAVPWQVLWEAMKVCPPDPDSDSLASEHGLEDSTWDGWWSEYAGTRMFGVRHGRQVDVRMGRTHRGLSTQGVQLTWVRAATPAFEAFGGGAGGVVAGDGAPLEVRSVLDGLTAAAAWDGIELVAGRDGLAVRRPTTMKGHQAGWLCDLWLCERLAERLRAPAIEHADMLVLDLPGGLR